MTPQTAHRSPLSRLALAAGVLLTLVGVLPAHALRQGSYTLEILVDGRPLPELVGRGRTYVEARAGHEYALRLTNQTGRRVAIALAVDGLNTIDAKTTAASEGAKWILDPWESIILEGWQTSSAVARRFFFTTEEASYGAWLGKTANLGVISAVVFRERLPEPAPRPISPSELERREEAPPPSAAPPGSAAGGASGALGRAARDAAAPAPQQKAVRPDEYAATGIGRRVEHAVERIAFDAEPEPAARIEVRYEYRSALVRLGLLPACPPLPDALARRERAHGFRDTGFAPDPDADPRRR